MIFLRSNIFTLLLIAATCCNLITCTRAYCSLEKMKKYAMEACEHLFLQDEAREKRSIDNANNYLNSNEHHRSHDSHFYTTIRRSVYPHGGYLKVGHKHFLKLSEVDVEPKYKAQKIHLLTNKKRIKREHVSAYDNLPYCCFQRCEEEFFC